jgi:hypothetical protein
MPKLSKMETIVRINNRSKAAKLFLEYTKTLSFARVERKFNKETLKALDDVKKR